MRTLTERVRFTGVWEGMKAFAVFQGAVITETGAASGAGRDSVEAEPRTRFQLIAVDSLREWKGSDCGRMRVP